MDYIQGRVYSGRFSYSCFKIIRTHLTSVDLESQIKKPFTAGDKMKLAFYEDYILVLKKKREESRRKDEFVYKFKELIPYTHITALYKDTSSSSSTYFAIICEVRNVLCLLRSSKVCYPTDYFTGRPHTLRIRPYQLKIT